MTAPTGSISSGSEIQTQGNVKLAEETKQRLEELFADTLDQGTSKAVIVFDCIDNLGNIRRLIGIPYTISRDGEYHVEGTNLDGYGDFYLEIGLYAKEETKPIPKDYEERKMRIPLYSILGGLRRVELTDFCLRK